MILSEPSAECDKTKWMQISGRKLKIENTTEYEPTAIAITERSPTWLNPANKFIEFVELSVNLLVVFIPELEQVNLNKG